MGIDYSLNINFNFHNGKELGLEDNWNSTYFTPKNNFRLEEDIKRISSSFNNSFFKLDYYDTPFSKAQKIYLTTILQASNGVKLNETIIPTYYLDYVENTEGFFIYWLKDKQILNIDTFYVSATFFNGKNGSTTRMANKRQSSGEYNLNDVFDFYYKIVLDYKTYTYAYYSIKDDSEVGVKNNPMNWYEYVTK